MLVKTPSRGLASGSENTLPSPKSCILLGADPLQTITTTAANVAGITNAAHTRIRRTSLGDQASARLHKGAVQRSGEGTPRRLQRFCISSPDGQGLVYDRVAAWHECRIILSILLERLVETGCGLQGLTTRKDVFVVHSHVFRELLKKAAPQRRVQRHTTDAYLNMMSMAGVSPFTCVFKQFWLLHLAVFGTKVELV